LINIVTIVLISGLTELQYYSDQGLCFFGYEVVDVRATDRRSSGEAEISAYWKDFPIPKKSEQVNKQLLQILYDALQSPQIALKFA
jgi:hypothetical protein